MDAQEIIVFLQDRHQAPDYIGIKEMRLGSGFGVSQRRIDFWALSTAPSKGNEATAYEVKVTRSDFLRDIRNPLKQRGARLYCDQFYFITPPDLIKPDEIPDWAGLQEVNQREPQIGSVYLFTKEIVPAPYLSKMRPSWPFVVSLLRRNPSPPIKAVG